MKMVNINGVEYKVLGEINTGKREYAFIEDSNENVSYCQKEGANYVIPTNELTLEGYASKSFSALNENVLFSYLTKRLGTDLEYFADLYNGDATLEEGWMRLESKSIADSMKELQINVNSSIKPYLPQAGDSNEVIIEKIARASKEYENIKVNIIYAFADRAADNINLIKPFDIEEVVGDAPTLFQTGLTEEVKASADNVLTEEVPITDPIEEELGKSILIPASEFIAPSEEVRPSKEELSNLDITQMDEVIEGAKDIAEIKEEIQKNEEIQKEEKEVSLTKPKVKTLKKNKKAAYVDTVILCLIAQLSIFGLLIIVLLVIK